MADSELEFAVKTCQTCPSEESTVDLIHTLLRDRTGAKPVTVEADESTGRKKLVFTVEPERA
jgi:hypothetical protein